jgi:hypothetical protein
MGMATRQTSGAGLHGGSCAAGLHRIFFHRVVATKIHPYRSTNMLLDDEDRDLGPELGRGQHVPPHAQLRELAPIGEAARERRRPFQVIALTDAVPSASSTVFSM